MEQISPGRKRVGLFLQRIGSGVRRFSVPFGYAVCVTLIRLVCDLFKTPFKLDSDAVLVSAWVAFGTGMALSAALQLWFEKQPVRHAKLLEILISAPVTAGLLVLLYLAQNVSLSQEWSSFTYLLTAAVFLASVLAGLSAVSRRGSDGSGVRSAVIGLFWAGVMFSITFGAFMLFFLAVNSLIADLPEELPYTLLTVSFMCVGTMTFLSFLPGPEDDRPHVRAYTVLFSYVLMPLFLIFLLILYVYIAQIAIRWEMPSGEMNPFGMCALFFFVIIWLALRGEEVPLAKWYTRFGGLFVLPVTAVQILGLAIRIRAYGLTPLRAASLVVVGVGLLTIVWSVLRAPLHVFFLITACVAVLALASPVNVVQVANFDQEVRLRQVMTKYGMILPDGSLSLDTSGLPDEDREKIGSGLSYFRYADGFLSAFGKTVQNEARESSITESGTEYRYCTYEYDGKLPVSVPEGAAVYYLGDLSFEVGEPCPTWTDPETGKTVSLDAEPFLRELTGLTVTGWEARGAKKDLSFSPDGRATVLISSLSVDINSDGKETWWHADAYSCWIVIPKDPAEGTDEL